MKNRMVGDLQISRVHELFLRVPTGDFFPDTPAADWEPYKAWLIAEKALNPEGTEIVLPVQSYVVRTSHHTILIDTCVGNDKYRPHREGWHLKTDDTYMQSLAAVGLQPEDIDYVMCTHLHHDHVGWNTKLVDGRWVPTFPNAKYLMSKTELEVFKAQEDPAASLSLIDSVLPVVESGQAELISSDYALDDEVWLEPTPGHTPDHFAVRFQSNRAGAVVGGDLMHCPVQCVHPEWRARPDFDPPMAVDTRRKFMDIYAETDTLVCMMHFPLPSCGGFAPQEEGFRFTYDTQDW